MSKINYDESVWDVFTDVCDQGVPITLNDRFSKYEERISEVFVDSGDDFYLDYDSDLFKECRAHSKEYSKKLNSKKIIGLVHPFYTKFSQMEILNSFQKGSYNKYVKNLKELFSRRNREIVVFDTIHHYAAITSNFLEEGVIDAAIITKNDSGAFNYRSDLSKFNRKTIFLGGGYNGRCLTSTAEELIDRTKDVSWIKGLCLDPPRKRKDEASDSSVPNATFSLFSKKVSPLKKSVPLDSLLD